MPCSLRTSELDFADSAQRAHKKDPKMHQSCAVRISIRSVHAFSKCTLPTPRIPQLLLNILKKKRKNCWVETPSPSATGSCAQVLIRGPRCRKARAHTHTHTHIRQLLYPRLARGSLHTTAPMSKAPANQWLSKLSAEVFLNERR